MTALFIGLFVITLLVVGVLDNSAKFRRENPEYCAREQLIYEDYYNGVIDWQELLTRISLLMDEFGMYEDAP